MERADILHFSYLHIKSHELKLTNLDYAFIPGEVYYAGETVSSNNYEDAHIALNPNYAELLQKDLQLIVDKRSEIDSIEAIGLSLYSGRYQIKLCLDHKKVNVLDSSLFKKTIYLDIVGQYELWDREGCDRLYVREDQKFWVRDSIIIKGRARREFINNKIDEIWLAQLSTHAQDMVTRFESPYKWDKYYINIGLYLRFISGRFFLPVERETLRQEGWSFHTNAAKS
ncbi:MAG: hypothetical protein ACJA01_002634 [Saprospiraceae bacterium]